MTVIEQKPILMANLKEKLEIIKKESGELNFRAEKVYSYLSEFITLSKKEADEKYAKLSGLGIVRLRDKQAVKLVDLMPDDPETLKSLFSGETLSLKQEEIKQILDSLQN